MNTAFLKDQLRGPAGPAIGSLLALTLAALLGAVWTPRWQAEADTRALAVRRAAASVSLGPTTRTATAPPTWPSTQRTPARGAALLALARRHGVLVQRTREQADPEGHVQIGVAGQATYPALRAFVAAALVADTALVLDRLRLQRAGAAVAELDIDMQWTLLHSAAAPDKAPPLRAERVAAAIKGQP